MTPQISVDTTTQVFSGNRQPDPDICLIHTIEAWGWPGYKGGKEAPHATVKPIAGKGIQVRVHRPPTDYGKALFNAPGGVETNRRGVWQLELMGTCDPSRKREMYYWPDADAVVLAALAEFCRPTVQRFNIPAVALAPFLPYPLSYGSKNGQRLSFSAWNKSRGFCGHQNAPENDHGDPGAFPITRFFQFLDPTNQENDMQLDEFLKADVYANPTSTKDKNPTFTFLGKENLQLEWDYQNTLRSQRIEAQLTTLTAAVQALAATGGQMTPDQLETALNNAAEDLFTRLAAASNPTEETA